MPQSFLASTVVSALIAAAITFITTIVAATLNQGAAKLFPQPAQ